MREPVTNFEVVGSDAANEDWPDDDVIMLTPLAEELSQPNTEEIVHESS